jgi:hypothetical protein
MRVMGNLAAKPLRKIATTLLLAISEREFKNVLSD